MKQAFSIVLLLIGFSITALCGNIVYPWRTTTAILKSGESFEVWFNADNGQTIHSIELNGPYNNASSSISTVAGNWVYDPMSGNVTGECKRTEPLQHLRALPHQRMYSSVEI